MTEILNGLSVVAERYDVLYCDVWGVIHNGRESFPAAVAALERFQRERGPVVLISNAPRPSRDVLPQLRALKVPQSSWSAFVTSGDATRAELLRRAPQSAWAVGPARDAPLYEATGVTFAETPHEADFVCCTGPFDDDIETPEHFRERFEICVARGLPMICANPDRVVQRGDKLIYCAGALADLYEALGGEVTMAGKPFAPIYDLCRTEAQRLLGRPVDPARVLCVGDGVQTDVLGANEQGLDVLFVAAGIHRKEAEGPDGALDPARVAEVLAAKGATAAYATGDLVW